MKQRIGLLRRISLRAWPSVLVVATLCIPALSTQGVALANPLNDAADTGAAFEHRGFSVTGGREEPLRYGSRSSQGANLAQTSAPESVATQLSAEQLAAEREFWASVKASEDPADIRAYLEQFPNGMFAALARNWLKRLEEAKAAQPRAPQATAAPAVATQEAAPAPSSSPESVEEALGLTRTQRVLVQRGLTSLGFDVGAADGILGARSRAGIRDWQSSRGEAATGYLDAGALETLLEAGEAVRPTPKRAVVREAMELLSEALTTTRSIDDPFSRAQALSGIAKTQASAGDIRGAAQTVSKALTTAQSIEKASYRARALSGIAEAQASAGDIEVALTTARSIQTASSRARALSGIAGAQASAGDTRGAAQTVSEALTAARSIQRAFSRALALSAIARAQASASDTRGAAQTVSDALATTRSIEIPFSRARALNYIVEAQASIGDIEAALSTAQSIEDASFRALALSDIAAAQATAGDTRGAAQTLSEALASVRRVEDALHRGPALRGIAGAQASAGDIQAALTTARSIEQEFNGAWALRSIAEAQASAGDIQAALTTARSIENAFQRAWALRDITKAQLNGADDRSQPGGATKRAAPGSSKRSVDSNGSTTRQEFWGAYVPGQTTPSTGRVIYPYDVFGISWNFSSPETALEAAAKRCRERSAHNCGDDHSVTFSSSADDSGYHLKSRCITAWVWANPGLSGLNEASWTSGVELPEYFQTIQVAEKKTACNER